MKRKILLPLLAVVFALAGAFASSPVVQMGWYNPGTGGEEGEITSPGGDTPVCGLSGSNTCKIQIGFDEYDAYNTQADANTYQSSGLLKFTP